MNVAKTCCSAAFYPRGLNALYLSTFLNCSLDPSLYLNLRALDMFAITSTSDNVLQVPSHAGLQHGVALHSFFGTGQLNFAPPLSSLAVEAPSDCIPVSPGFDITFLFRQLRNEAGMDILFRATLGSDLEKSAFQIVHKKVWTHCVPDEIGKLWNPWTVFDLANSFAWFSLFGFVAAPEKLASLAHHVSKELGKKQYNTFFDAYLEVELEKAIYLCWCSDLECPTLEHVNEPLSARLSLVEFLAVLASKGLVTGDCVARCLNAILDTIVNQVGVVHAQVDWAKALRRIQAIHRILDGIDTLQLHDPNVASTLFLKFKQATVAFPPYVDGECLQIVDDIENLLLRWTPQ